MSEEVQIALTIFAVLFSGVIGVFVGYDQGRRDGYRKGIEMARAIRKMLGKEDAK